MPPKKPRRTAERILEVTLALFNRFGVRNVSTTLISSELAISPGNLYYHYPAKDELVNALFGRYEQRLHVLLSEETRAATLDEAAAFCRRLLELNWAHRFLHRDLNDLLCNNRTLELRHRALLADLRQAVHTLLSSLQAHGALPPVDDLEPLGQSMLLTLQHWLCLEHALDPRQAEDEQAAHAAIERGVRQVRSLLQPLASLRVSDTSLRPVAPVVRRASPTLNCLEA